MRYIFIGGANHSGSTTLGAILGSDPLGPFRYFHTGELHSFFKRGSRTFGNSALAGKMPSGELWNRVDPQLGYGGAWRQIQALVDPTILVDSSKKREFLKDVIESGFPLDSLSILLSYRPFAAIRTSDERRGKPPKFTVSHLLEYRYLMDMAAHLGISLRAINMERLIESPSLETMNLCRAVGVPYFPGKEEYWNFVHCHLYGAATTRRHISEPTTAEFSPPSIVGVDQNIRAPLFPLELRKLEDEVAELCI